MYQTDFMCSSYLTSEEMNIRVILLSMCLYFTLEMTKINGILLEAEVLGAVTNLDTIMSVQRLMNNKNLEVYSLLQRLQKDSEKLSLGMSNQVNILTIFIIGPNYINSTVGT